MKFGAKNIFVFIFFFRPSKIKGSDPLKWGNSLN